MDRGDRVPRIYVNFHYCPYTAHSKSGYFHGPHMFMGFLHPRKNYIFGLSFPIASFWCAHCFCANTGPWRLGAPNFRKFPLLPKHSEVKIWLLSRPARVCGLFAPTQELYFWALLPHSFLLIWTLLCCKHGTVATGCTEFTYITIIAHIPRSQNLVIFTARTG